MFREFMVYLCVSVSCMFGIQASVALITADTIVFCCFS